MESSTTPIAVPTAVPEPAPAAAPVVPEVAPAVPEVAPAAAASPAKPQPEAQAEASESEASTPLDSEDDTVEMDHNSNLSGPMFRSSQISMLAKQLIQDDPDLIRISSDALPVLCSIVEDELFVFMNNAGSITRHDGKITLSCGDVLLTAALTERIASRIVRQVTPMTSHLRKRRAGSKVAQKRATLGGYEKSAITSIGIRRAAYRAQMPRVSQSVIEPVRIMVVKYMDHLLKLAAQYAKYDGRYTIRCQDIDQARVFLVGQQ